MLCKKKHQSSSKAWPRYSNFLYNFVINGSLLSAFRGNISVRLIVSIGISQIVPDFFYICLRGMIVIFLIWSLFAINTFSSLRIYKTSMKWQNIQWVGKFKILNFQEQFLWIFYQHFRCEFLLFDNYSYR